MTRCAVTTDAEAEKQQGDNRTMGRKFTIPYGLYRVHGYISPHLADPQRNGTGFSEQDLEILKRALNQMFDIDRSAARGEMRPRHCIAFKHESALGNARSDKLFNRVAYRLKEEIRKESRPPRSFEGLRALSPVWRIFRTGSRPRSGSNLDRWSTPTKTSFRSPPCSTTSSARGSAPLSMSTVCGQRTV